MPRTRSTKAAPPKRSAPTKKSRRRKKKPDAVPTIWRRLAKEIPFGPLFFIEKLGELVRDRSPKPEEGLPLVHLHLADGEVLDLSHVIAFGDRFAAFAVYEGSESPTEKVRTELVPFEIITRISIRTQEAAEPQIGFRLDRESEDDVKAKKPG
ncbi:MAG: hypothetical protein HYV07_16665 [Deltaproteobacteria bacterium]|nr:hypothetical protein [Deltaproteobacteria bacterium]